jgi:hypothetical protein
MERLARLMVLVLVLVLLVLLALVLVVVTAGGRRRLVCLLRRLYPLGDWRRAEWALPRQVLATARALAVC